ncbi:MAG: hypothetical protein HQL73_07175 [Magnetococcales bacterium]|nr:hypothetical protein [Magnetococcales bacterium]
MTKKITETDVANVLAKLKAGNGMDLVGLLRRLPECYLAEAVVGEVEDGAKLGDHSFFNGMGAMLWRAMQIHNLHRATD